MAGQTTLQFAPTRIWKMTLHRKFATLVSLASQQKRALEMRSLLGKPKLLDLTISTFGCCRQDSLSEIARTTGIRDGLTYPHNTKEIIQAIQYCQGSSDFPGFAFRNFQLGAKLASQARLRKWFDATDLFVVEISSRNVFESEGVVLHHVALEERQHIPTRLEHQVPIPTKRIQSDQEISDDIEQIVSLLGGPAKVLLVTHFSTYQGARSELAAFIEATAQRLGVECFNPSSLLGQWTPEELFLSENVLAHYTPKGHQIAGNRYRRHLQAIQLRHTGDVKAWVQVVDDSSEKVEKYGMHGFGDIALGAAFLFQLSRRHGRILELDWNKSHLNSVIASRTWMKGDNFENGPVRYIFHDSNLKEFAKFTRVFTNIRPVFPLDTEVKDFLREQFFTFDSEVTETTQQMLKSLKISPGNFIAVHVRLGDNAAFASSTDPIDYSSLLRRLKEFAMNAEVPLLILSDSKAFKDACKDAGLNVSASLPAHIGRSAQRHNSAHPAIGALVDLQVLSQAKSIVQFSTYGWGSSFSRLAAETFDLDCSTYPISLSRSSVQLG